MAREKEIIYYESLEQEILPPLKKEKVIDAKYKYVSTNPFAMFFTFIAYRLIVTPIAALYTKMIRRVRFENKAAFKKVKKTGYFIYANHTSAIGDAFIPNTLTFPRTLYMITSPANVSLPILGTVTKALGALPLPSDFTASKNFMRALEKRLDQNAGIVIYPEARLWPWATFIRPFDKSVLRYPVKYKKPLLVLTTTYQKTKRGRLKTIVYVDGPFFPSGNDQKEEQKRLYEIVSSTLITNAAKSNYQKVIYQKKEQL